MYLQLPICGSHDSALQHAPPAGAAGCAACPAPHPAVCCACSPNPRSLPATQRPPPNIATALLTQALRPGLHRHLSLGFRVRRALVQHHVRRAAARRHHPRGPGRAQAAHLVPPTAGPVWAAGGAVSGRGSGLQLRAGWRAAAEGRRCVLERHAVHGGKGSSGCWCWVE